MGLAAGGDVNGAIGGAPNMAADGDARGIAGKMTDLVAPAAESRLAVPSFNAAAALRYGKISIPYLAASLLLEWGSWVFAIRDYNISPWNPPSGLALATLLIFGLRFAPLVLVAAIVGDIVIRGSPVPLHVSLLAGLAQTVGYAAAAWLMERRLGFKTTLASLRDLTIMLGATFLPSAAIALVFVGVYVGFGMLPEAGFAEAVLRYWVGDAIGILVTAPLLLRLRDMRQFPVRPVEIVVQFVVLAACLWFIAMGKMSEQLKFFHILFLPVIWLAVRQGLSGAAIACFAVQVGLILDAVQDNLEAAVVIELQMLLMILAITAMFTGVLVDERRVREEGRERMREQMRHLARLSLSGEIATGLAHELNQPLTALLNYVRVGRAQLERGEAGAALDPIVKAEAQGLRAAETILRLRGFLRGGALTLSRFEIAPVIEETVQMLNSAVKPRDIAIRVDIEPPIAAVLADRVHVMQILANLMSNAFDSIAAAGAVPGIVEIAARRKGPVVEVAVYDNGPGVSAEARDRIFDSFFTTRAHGMGLGLAISRSLVEAQGGVIRYEPAALAGAGRHRFVFTLKAAEA